MRLLLQLRHACAALVVVLLSLGGAQAQARELAVRHADAIEAAWQVLREVEPATPAADQALASLQEAMAASHTGSLPAAATLLLEEAASASARRDDAATIWYFQAAALLAPNQPERHFLEARLILHHVPWRLDRFVASLSRAGTAMAQSPMGRARLRVGGIGRIRGFALAFGFLFAVGLLMRHGGSVALEIRERSQRVLGFAQSGVLLALLLALVWAWAGSFLTVSLVAMGVLSPYLGRVERVSALLYLGLMAVLPILEANAAQAVWMLAGQDALPGAESGFSALTRPGGEFSMALVGVVLALLVLMPLVSRWLPAARRCADCATPVTRSLLPAAWEVSLCVGCYQLARVPELLSETHTHQLRERIASRAELGLPLRRGFNLLLPGMGSLIAGEGVRGILLLAALSWGLHLLVSPTLLPPLPFAPVGTFSLNLSQLFAGLVLGGVWLTVFMGLFLRGWGRSSGTGARQELVQAQVDAGAALELPPGVERVRRRGRAWAWVHGALTAALVVLTLFLAAAWQRGLDAAPRQAQFPERPSGLELARIEQQRVRFGAASQIFYARYGRLPPSLMALVDDGLLDAAELTFPTFGESWHYRIEGEAIRLYPPRL